MRNEFYAIAALTLVAIAAIAIVWPPVLWSLVVIAPLLLLGLYNTFQTEHTILRNFPLIGYGRYIMEGIRPEIQQYFVERDTDENPISREKRSIVYQRAKGVLDTHPFGTQRDVYEPGREWVCHSLEARLPHDEEEPRVTVGSSQCDQPYSASIFNISAMSFGSLSPTAVEAMNMGAAKGDFLHNTGEGGISPYHLEHGADLTWQIGTAYFGCRADGGGFDPEQYEKEATREEVKCIELKFSQGAKPGHGGILPGKKVTEEIAEIRGVPPGEDVLSPPAHSAFSTPTEMLEFLQRLRDLSGGKPVGFKLCLGQPHEFMGICKAVLETGIYPDFITVDGKEGGTGAGPLEFVNAVGIPMREGLTLVDNALRGIGVRDEVTIFTASKILTGFDIFRALALGADACNAARAMMLAIGCIQARRCNKDNCPTGVATQSAELYEGIDVPTKGERVYRYHKETVESFLELIGAAGIARPSEISPEHVMQRVDEATIKNFEDLYPRIPEDALLEGNAPEFYERAWQKSDASDFNVDYAAKP
jgi:glutamate synthase domain-containing protein 2